MNQRELIANMEVCAERLTGRAVVIRLKSLPNVAGLKAYGITQRDLDGRAVIDLDPANFQNVRTFAETFTHELAHVVKHFDGLPRRDIEQGIAREITKQALSLSSGTRGNPTVKQHEAEADALADEWMKVIDRHYLGYAEATHDPILAVLKILYHKVK